MAKQIDVSALSHDGKVRYGLRLGDSAQVAVLATIMSFLTPFTLLVLHGVGVMADTGDKYYLENNQLMWVGISILVSIPASLYAISTIRAVLVFRKNHRAAYRDGQKKLASLAPSERWIWKTNPEGDPIQKKPKK